MKKTMRSYLLSVLVGVLTLLFAVGFAACGDETSTSTHTLKFVAGEGFSIPDIVADAGAAITPPSDPEQEGFEFEGWYLNADSAGDKQSLPTVMPDEDLTYYAKWTALPQITLSLDGGTIEGEKFYLKAGSDLYAFMQEHLPTRTGYEFGKWTWNGRDLKAGDVMPAGGATLSAVWKAPYKVKLYKLDFATYDNYVEDGTVVTAYSYAGESVDGSAYVPEHYMLNTEKTNAVTVSESGDSELSVYVDPIYTRYTDVFEGMDYLYELEAESGVLYLDRIGMEEGRKKSASYDKGTGAFSFETDEENFKLEGVISGEKFYYYRDTINRLFHDYLGSDATLEIVSSSEVTYVPETGSPVKGSYTVDVEAGKYLFVPKNGEPMQFVLIESASILYFRLHDGVEGWYAYDGELTGGGWSILGFDGFGVATSLDDDGVIVEYDYYARGNGIVSIPDLGLVKVENGTHEDLGGHAIKGTFRQSDGNEGTYLHVHGYRTHVLELDGFGVATRYYYGEDEPTTVVSTGTYEFVRDETWLTRSNGMVGYYGGVNEYLLYTATAIQEAHADFEHFDTTANTAKYLLSESEDDMGETALAFDALNEEMLDVPAGVHALTSSFVFMGTSYTVDSTHKAFLYFYYHEYNSSGQEVDLWYGSYSETYGADVYELLIWGAWYPGYFGNELYNYDFDYDGMYFTDMEDDGSFAFDHEEWDGEAEKYVFYNGDDGSLEIDAKGEAYFYPAEGDPVKVSYHELATGLISILEFDLPDGVPPTVHSLYALYNTYYDLTAEEEKVIIYDLEAAGVLYLTVAYADGSEGGDIVIVVTHDLTFIGVLYSDEEGNSALEFLFAGSTSPVDGSADEYTFTNNDSIYYEGLDYYDDSDVILETFGEFRFKVVGEEFFYYDGYVFDLKNGQDTLTTDGYGSATLTVGGQTTEGSYYMDYDILVFTPAAAAGEVYYYVDETAKTFAPVDGSTQEGLLLGYYYGTALDKDGLPSGVLSSGLHLNGKGGFIYESVAFDEDGYDFEILTETGTYQVLSGDLYVTGRLYASYTLALTFDTDGAADVREAKIMIYDLYDDGGYYPFFIIQDKALMGQYDAYTDDGAELGSLMGGDGYIEESASFVGEDANGPFRYEGYMARGTIDDRYYDAAPQFSADKDGNVIVFVTYIDDEMVQYVFDLGEDGKVYYRDKFYGAVAEYKVQGGTTGNYLYLDGHSKATLYNSEGVEQSTGTYEFVPTLKDTYAYIVGGKTQFYFKPAVTSYGGGVLYIYSVYGAGEDQDYFNGDWSIFSMDGFGNAVYVDKYGVVYSGEYYQVIANEEVYCLKVTGTTKLFYFELNDDGTFSLLQGEFLIRGDVLYVYFGADESIVIPENVRTIATGAFKLNGALNIKKIDFNNVTTIEDEAFYYATSLEELVSDKIESVGASAFEHLWSLTKVDLPNCRTIGEKAFFDCVYLEEVKLGKIEEIGKFAFTHSTALIATPFTLDLTAVDLSKLTVDLSAFLNKRFEYVSTATMMVEGSKILVGGGIEGLNAAMRKFKGKTSEIEYCDLSDQDKVKTGQVSVDLSAFIALAVTEEGEAVSYYDLKTDKVFVLEGGTATLYEKSSYSYEEASSYSYYVENGVGTLYAYDAEAGQFVSKGTFSLAGTSVTVDGVTFLKSEESGTTGAKVNGKDVVITYKASVSTSYGVNVTFEVTGVSYNGKAADSFAYNSYDKLLEFNAEGHGFSAKLENGEFTVTDLGEQYVLEDKSQDIRFRLTVTVSEGKKIELVKAEYDPYGDGTYYELSYGLTKISDGVWSYVSSYFRYTLNVTFSEQGDPTLSVTFDGYVIEKSGFTITLKVSEDFTKFDRIIEIKSGDKTIDISGIVYNSERTIATLTVEGDGTYIIKIEPYDYSPNFTLTVTHTDYDTTESGLVFSGDDMYSVEVSVHVDGEGNMKITGLNKFKDFMSEEDVPYTSATPNDDGSLTIKLGDGRTAKLTIEMSPYGSVSFDLEWVE